MARKVMVKVRHQLAGGSLGHLTASVTQGLGEPRVELFKLTFDETAAERMPDGFGRILHETVKRHVAQWSKDTRFCFTEDPVSGFQCEMREL